MAYCFEGRRTGHRFRNVRKLIALFQARQGKQIEQGGNSNEKTTGTKDRNRVMDAGCGGRHRDDRDGRGSGTSCGRR